MRGVYGPAFHDAGCALPGRGLSVGPPPLNVELSNRRARRSPPRDASRKRTLEHGAQMLPCNARAPFISGSDSGSRRGLRGAEPSMQITLAVAFAAMTRSRGAGTFGAMLATGTDGRAVAARVSPSFWSVRSFAIES